MPASPPGVLRVACLPGAPRITSPPDAPRVANLARATLDTGSRGPGTGDGPHVAAFTVGRRLDGDADPGRDRTTSTRNGE